MTADDKVENYLSRARRLLVGKAKQNGFDESKIPGEYAIEIAKMIQLEELSPTTRNEENK